MEIPRVNPVGLVEHPEDYTSTPRQRPLWLRGLVLILLLIFGGVTLVTTVVSLGQYCLTSNTGDTRNLPTHPKGEAGE